MHDLGSYWVVDGDKALRLIGGEAMREGVLFKGRGRVGKRLTYGFRAMP